MAHACVAPWLVLAMHRPDRKRCDTTSHSPCGCKDVTHQAHGIQEDDKVVIGDGSLLYAQNLQGLDSSFCAHAQVEDSVGGELSRRRVDVDGMPHAARTYLA